MKLSTSIGLVLACVGMLASPAGAAQGVLVVQTTTTNGTARTAQVQIEPQRMRTEIADGGGAGQVIIFDGAKQVMYMINPARKTYSEMTKADVDRTGAQMSEAMAKMQEAMKNIPPAQRAQMEAMMRGRGLPGAAATPAKTEYRKAGTQKVGKWTCDVYEGYQNNAKTGEVCTVSPQALGFTAADFEVSRQLATFLRGLIPQGADALFQAGKIEEQGYSGVPVRQVMNVAGREIVTELTDVTRQTFPDSLFEVPAGLQKQASPFGLGGPGR
jgi:hypothetical protein